MPRASSSTVPNILCLLGAVLLTLVLLEAVLRFLPVLSGRYYQIIDESQPITKYLPDEAYTWSQKWNFKNVNRGRVNNDGFVNEQDYVKESDTPLVAVIGDSYIEARMVSYDKTLQGRLQTYLRDSSRVYSFGMNGAPLSQYLVLGGYAMQAYRPDKVIFFIVGNDFDNSFPEYYLRYSHHQFFRNADGTYRVDRALDFHPDWLRFVLRHSALARYVLYNLGNEYRILNIRTPDFIRQAQERHPGLVYRGERRNHHDSRIFSQESLRAAYQATDLFLSFLPGYVPLDKEDVLFVLDAPEYLLGPMHDDPSYFTLTRSYLIARLEEEGYRYVDMVPAFRDHYQQGGVSLRVPHDGHLNDVAHGYMAQAVEESGFLD